MPSVNGYESKMGLASTRRGNSGGKIAAAPSTHARHQLPAREPTDGAVVNSHGGAVSFYMPTLNGTEATTLSHMIVSWPPASLMSVKSHVSCSIDNGSVASVIGARTTSLSAV